MRRSWGLIGLALAVALIGVIVVRSHNEAAQAGKLAGPPVTIPVERGEVLKTVTAPGQLIGTRAIVLSAATGGQIARIDVRPGDEVKTGQVLLQLDAQPLQQALDAAQAAFDRATQEQARQHAEAELALGIAEDRLAQTQARYPGLTAAEVRLRQAQDAVNFTQDELNKALNRPWETEAALDGYRHALQSAQDALAIAQAEHAAARGSQIASGQELNILEAEVEQARLALERLNAGIDPSLKANLDQAQHALDAATLTAPFDGVVVEVDARPGEWVTAGQALLVLVDPRAVEVQATLVEEDMPLVQAGQTAELFFDALPEAEVAGHVTRIVPQRAAGDRPLFPVYVALDDAPAGVAPGMTVDASIVIDSRADVVRLPRGLVKTRSDGTAQVKVWLGDRVETRTVKAGLRGDVYVEILEGLQAGEQVVGE